MHYAYLELEKYDNVDDEKFYQYNEVDPVDILRTSYEQCIRDCTMEGIIGSSTALIAILREDELRIANLGDCGISIIRRNDFTFRSEEQQHSFNFPYQLGTGSFDTPQDAQRYTIKVQCGDIVILGSDGIFDNLFEEDILEEIDRFFCPRTGTPSVHPQMISEALAYRAKNASEDLNNPSPFQSRAMQEGLYYLGGKKDDISVLVGIVTDSKDFSN
ncbi:14928_t:CDS:2 [Acaulospora colombiana]|uniref:14928_t:CDS:1 n=1 Tax=Acaulospora colombiana TaxID=27376 RepID=A0ACA9K9A1_9GLOM|nr:14928_t:CDS:2 [Acaulospora colombiana]